MIGLVRGAPALVGCALLVALVMLLPACSAGGGDDSFADRLGLLPASAVAGDPGPHQVVVRLADLDRAAQLAGITKPADVDDRDAVLDYLLAMGGAGPEPVVAALFPVTANESGAVQGTAPIDEFDREVGWSVLDLSWYVETFTTGDRLMVAGADVDEARLTAAMGERMDGIWRVGGADGTRDLAGITAARSSGESLRTAVDGDRLIVGWTTRPVREALDGGAPTLADNPTLRALAEAMDGQGAYSAVLNDGGDFGGGSAAESLPRPFTGLATGLTVTDGAPVVLLAYVHPTPEDAQANARALGELLTGGHAFWTGAAWDTLFTAHDIRADGATLIARLGLVGDTGPQILGQLALGRDSFIRHV